MAELPDYLTDQSLEAIHGRMLTAMPENLDKSEGSMPWDTTIPAAIELTLAAEWAKEVLRRGFAKYTFGAYLDLRAEEHGVTRKDAVSATGTLHLTGDPGTIIPEGRLFMTVGPADPILFRVTETVMIDEIGEAEADIVAVNSGTSGNVATGMIINIMESLPGLTAVTNPNPTSGGLERESDEALLARYLQKVRNPSTGGNRSDYANWALEVPGVSAVVVLPLWDGPGTVKVVILGSDKQPASPEIVASAQAYISPDPAMGTGTAPIGALVTVAAAEPVTIDVSATVTYSGETSLPTIQAAFSAALTDYLMSIAFSSDPSVKFVRIGSMLLDIPGVQDYSGLLLNGTTDNVDIDVGEVAVVGTVTLS